MFLLAEGGDASVRHRLKAVRRLVHLQLVSGRGGEGRLEEVAVEATVGHGSVEAADGPDADGERLGFQRPPEVVADLGLQLQRGGRRAEALRLRLVEPPPLPRPRPLSVLHHSCCHYTWKWDCSQHILGNIFPNIL